MAPGLCHLLVTAIASMCARSVYGVSVAEPISVLSPRWNTGYRKDALPMTASNPRAAGTMRPAVHRTILVADMEGFGDRHRTNPRQILARQALYRALERAFHYAGIHWDQCYREDLGDGVFMLAPAEMPKSLFVETLPQALVEALCAHNRVHGPEEWIRLRMALHAGEVNYDDYGVTAAAITLAFRLVNAGPLKAALAEPSRVLALILSPWFFDEVVRNSAMSDPANYRLIQVAVKETRTPSWIWLPKSPMTPASGQSASAMVHTGRSLAPPTWAIEKAERPIRRPIVTNPVR